MQRSPLCNARCEKDNIHVYLPSSYTVDLNDIICLVYVVTIIKVPYGPFDGHNDAVYISKKEAASKHSFG